MSSLVENRKKDNRRIPLYFVMAFMVVFVVNGFFVYMAVTTNHGVVTENAYEKGLNFNRVVSDVREMKAQKENGTSTP